MSATTVGKKPQYRWRDGHFQELVHDIDNVLSLPSKGTCIACWNDFESKWEFGISTGTRIDRFWHIGAVPNEFRTYLLLMGVS